MTPRVDAHVVVVGGGCTGLLTALELERRGMSSIVVEERALGGGQTAHAHGWLHHGHIYAEATLGETEAFRDGAAYWLGLAREHGVTPLSSRSYVAFGDERLAADAVDRWSALGLPHERARRTYAAFAHGHAAWWSDEAAVIPAAVLRAATGRSRVRVLGGRGVRVSTGDPDTLTVVVETRTGSVEIRAGRVVVAVGADADGPLAGDSVSRRDSHMLVVESSVELPASFAVPEAGALGLFAVRRDSGHGAVYLVSNFLSSRTRASDRLVAGELWRGSMAHTLSRYLPALWDDPSARWGVYPAPKSEAARSVALGAPGASVERRSEGRVYAVTPGKLTLAPVLATAIADELAGMDRNYDVDDRYPRLTAARDAEWSKEDWEMTPLHSRNTLFSGWTA